MRADKDYQHSMTAQLRIMPGQWRLKSLALAPYSCCQSVPDHASYCSGFRMPCIFSDKDAWLVA
jgi:hypothetical protein